LNKRESSARLQSANQGERGTYSAPAACGLLYRYVLRTSHLFYWHHIMPSSRLLWVCQYVFFSLCLLRCVRSQAAAAAANMHQTNLLLIMFDDLRPELNAYGRSHMLTPNFDRLAAKSVLFDKAYAQISVCNPSRDSMLTGLRPDTVGTYGFQSSFRPHLIFPTQLVRSGYSTAGYGKIAHWEGPDPLVWSHDSWENKWYEFQNEERRWMNSSTMPDKVKREEDFRDYEFTSRLIKAMRELAHKPQYFMTAIGYKLPHLAVHVPYKYYEMYKGKDKAEAWKLNKKELRFPPSSPEVSYRCCANPYFEYMNEEGAKRASKMIPIGDINHAFTEDMHNELMLGYCGAISFVDTQVGRILDVVDELKLWNNLTIVLTADHGMHNGEKGIWEKWSMFDESTRVPLMISHPLSPFKGQHYTEPVELIDVFPTVIDLLNPPTDKRAICKTGTVCHPLQGKSLAPIVLGSVWQNELNRRATKSGKTKKGDKVRRNLRASAASESSEVGARGVGRTMSNSSRSLLGEEVMIKALGNDFAISQSWRCANKAKVIENTKAQANALAAAGKEGALAGGGGGGGGGGVKVHRYSHWIDCDKTKNPTDEISVMGYSLRTSDFRYTAWFHYNRVQAIPILDVQPYQEELYDHRGETLADFTHQEIVNLVHKQGYESTSRNLRDQLIAYIRKKIVFRGPFTG